MKRTSIYDISRDYASIENYAKEPNTTPTKAGFVKAFYNISEPEKEYKPLPSLTEKLVAIACTQELSQKAVQQYPLPMT